MKVFQSLRQLTTLSSKNDGGKKKGRKENSFLTFSLTLMFDG
jgi:hypothetical protein